MKLISPKRRRRGCGCLLVYLACNNLLSMESVGMKYPIGAMVLLNGKIVKIQDRSRNVNGIPVYKINNTWYSERVLNK